jgi:hypothetical protein
MHYLCFAPYKSSLEEFLQKQRKFKQHFSVITDHGKAIAGIMSQVIQVIEPNH